MFNRLLLFLGFATLFFGPGSFVFAQIENVEIGVDGLACPFCSYGLEKKLKKVDGVDEVKIFVDKGLAQVKPRPTERVEFTELTGAVKNAGFTPGEIKTTVVGKLTDGVLVVKLGSGVMRLLLKDDAKLKDLRSALQEGDAYVRVKGMLMLATSEGPDHPYTLMIEDFEVVG